MVDATPADDEVTGALRSPLLEHARPPVALSRRDRRIGPARTLAMPGVGVVAVLRDPDGATFGLLEPESSA